jgi:Tol biopolymer transport system component
MSAPRHRLTDEMIERALRGRTAAPDDALLGDILRSIETLPQRHAAGGSPIPIQRRTIVLLAAALLLALLAGAIAVGSGILRPQPIFRLVERSNGMIVTARQCGLVGIEPSSGARRQLVAGAPGCLAGDYAVAYATAWSSDGARMAYALSRFCGGCPPLDNPGELEELSGVWLFDAGSGTTEQLLRCRVISCGPVDISPDGTRVAAAAQTLDATQNWLYLMDADGGDLNPIELRQTPVEIHFSPEGDRIVLTMWDGQVSTLQIIDADGSDLRVLFSDAAAPADDPVWSPDGQRVAFDAGGATASIWVVDADGTDATQLTSSTEGGVPAWSPDGSRIAYVRTPVRGNQGQSNGFEVWVMNADGSGKARVYESSCCMSDWRAPFWSPDGEWIAFGVGVDANPQDTGLFVVRPDGTELRRISPETGSPFISPIWQPLP